MMNAEDLKQVTEAFRAEFEKPQSQVHWTADFVKLIIVGALMFVGQFVHTSITGSEKQLPELKGAINVLTEKVNLMGEMLAEYKEAAKLRYTSEDADKDGTIIRRELDSLGRELERQILISGENAKMLYELQTQMAYLKDHKTEIVK